MPIRLRRAYDPAEAADGIWNDFRKRYWRELDRRPEAWASLLATLQA
jgi:uncharacterized protein YeaO (DUF488 family)